MTKMEQFHQSRFSWKTTPKHWAQVRTVGFILVGVSSILISPVCPFTIPVAVATWLEFGIAIAGSVGITAHLTKN